MPPAPAPSPPVPKAGGPKQMPKWAWPVAIGGGLLVGFFLLRKQPEEYESETEEGSAEEGQRKGGGGGGALPIPPEMREALGLEPPSSEWGGGGVGDPGSSDAYGDSTGDTGQQTSLAYDARQAVINQNPYAYSSTPVSSGFTPAPAPNATSPAYTQGLTLPGSSAPIPTTSGGGGGSGAHKAQ